MSSGGVVDWSRSPSPWARTTSGFGMIVFLASDVMLFAGFFGAYFLLRATTSPWPAADVDLNVPRTAVFTLTLAASSLTLIAGERAFRRNDLRGLRRWILITMALGAAFLLNQLLDYTQIPYRISTNVYGSTYWMLTGLHTAHVTVGLCALGLLFVRAARARHVGAVGPAVSTTSAFWHLVDVIWIFLFVVIWIIR